MSDSPLTLLAANCVMMAYSIEHFLSLRVCLSIGCLLFAIWAITSAPILLDTAMFNTVMFLFNVRHAMKLWYAQRYIEFPPEYEKIYKKVFKPYLNNRVDFKKLVDISYIRTEKKGEVFKRKGDEVTSLCCLVKGRISVVRQVEFEPVSILKHNMKSRKVKSFNRDHLNIKMYNYGDRYDDRDEHDRKYQDRRTDRNDRKESVMHALVDDADGSDIQEFLWNQHFINLCRENQFIEAPQWVTANLRPDGDRFTVSFVAVDDCEYIKWPKENLIDLIDSNEKIYNALNGVLGLHTAHALIASRKYAKIQDELSIGRSNTNLHHESRRGSLAAQEKKEENNNDNGNNADIDEEEEEEEEEEVEDNVDDQQVDK